MKIVSKFLLRCVLTVLLCGGGWGWGTKAQDNSPYVIRKSRLTVEDGLISNIVLCGLQDSRGFIWLGTPEGLQRYDGKSFLLFTKEKSGLHDNGVAQITEDRDGRIWLLYGNSETLAHGQGHTDLFDIRTHHVRPLSQAFGGHLPFPPGAIKWVFNDERRNVFLITGDNALWMYRGGGFFRRLLQAAPRQNFYPHGSLYQAWAGAAWLSSDTELVRVDTFGRTQWFANRGRLKANCVFHLYADGRCLALATPSRATENVDLEDPAPLYVAAPGRGLVPSSVRLFPPGQPREPGRYLIEYRFDTRTRAVLFHNPLIGLHLLTDSGAIRLLEPETLAAEAPLSPYAYFTDQNGGHWLCTPLGIFRFQIAPTYFKKYLTRAQLPASTAVGNQVRGIGADRNGLLYAGRDGLYQLTAGTALKQAEEHPLLVQGDEEGLWFSYGGNLSRIGPDGIRHDLPLRLPPEAYLWTMYRSRHGTRYLGGDGYIGRLAGDSAVALHAEAGVPAGSICYQFLEEPDGRILAVTSAGLLEVRDRAYRPFSPPSPSTRLQYVHQDRGSLWLCTAGDGLIHWNPLTGAIRRYGMDEGLPSNTLYTCLPDGNGFFWISSNNGLVRFDPRTGRSQTFTKKDGLPDNEFNRISFYKAPDGRLYFGGVNGIVTFNPDAIPVVVGKPFAAPLVPISLEQFDTRRGRLFDKSATLAATGRIVLEPDDRFAMLTVRLLDYTPGMERYDYRIEGLDPLWQSSGNGVIRLEKLPYGTYTLHVRGQNAEGAWSTSELRIPLQVQVPFYRRGPFLVFIAVTGLFLLFLGFRTRVRILERRNRRLEGTIAQRTGELRQSLAQKDVLMKEIHHRVKNNLQVISALQHMQASRSTDPHVKAALADAQNRVLSIAFIHHNLYQHDDLKGVEMKSFMRELAAHVLEVGITGYKQIEVVQDVEPVSLDIDTAVPLGLIINELFTNSCKHAFNGRETGRIVVGLHQKAPGTYELIYWDDGPGLNPEMDFQKSASLGLKLIYQLAEQLDGSMHYQAEGQGGFTLIFQDFERRNTD